MATESIGKTVVMDNDFADRFIRMQEEVDRNPPASRTREIKWGDSKKIAAAIRQKYGYAEQLLAYPPAGTPQR